MKTTCPPATEALRPDNLRQWHGITRVLAAAALAIALASCSILGAGTREASTIYTLDPHVTPQADWPSADWQLSLTPANASRSTDNLRITVRPTANELQIYKGARWAKVPTEMVEDALLQTLEDSGKLRAIARQGTGVNADYKLVLDLRRFDSDYANGANPAATIELNAKLLHAPDQKIVAARTFVQAQPAASADIGDVVNAFEQSLQTLTGDLTGWILTSGNQHEREGH
ncbi:ABC-type transport auxiliary lipoprotein family protein [Lysobacter sp. A289]